MAESIEIDSSEKEQNSQNDSQIQSQEQKAGIWPPQKDQGMILQQAGEGQQNQDRWSEVSKKFAGGRNYGNTTLQQDDLVIQNEDMRNQHKRGIDNQPGKQSQSENDKNSEMMSMDSKNQHKMREDGHDKLGRMKEFRVDNQAAASKLHRGDTAQDMGHQSMRVMSNADARHQFENTDLNQHGQPTQQHQPNVEFDGLVPPRRAAAPMATWTHPTTGAGISQKEQKNLNEYAQLSHFRLSLYQQFPHKASDIDQIYNDFCMMYESSSGRSAHGGSEQAQNDQTDKSGTKPRVSPRAQQQQDGGAESSSALSMQRTSKFDVLIERLKSKLNADNFFNYLQMQQCLQQEFFQSSSSTSNLTSPCPEDLSAYNNMQKNNSDNGVGSNNKERLSARSQNAQVSSVRSEYQRIERQNFEQADKEVQKIVEQGHMPVPHHLPSFKREPNPEASNPLFKHSGGMKHDDMENEFVDAKWIVLTSPAPAIQPQEKMTEAFNKIMGEYMGQTATEMDNEEHPDRGGDQPLQAVGPNAGTAGNSQPGVMQIPAQKRYAHSAVMAANSMFIFGGLVSGSKGGNLQSFYRCELNINIDAPQYLFQWEKIKADLPRPRDSHSCIKIHNFIVMFGGCGSGKANSFNDLNKYDLDQKMWTKLEAGGEIPPPREAHVAHAFDNDKMFIHGGVNQDEHSFDDAYVLTGLSPQIDRNQSQMYLQQQKQELESQSLLQQMMNEDGGRRTSRSQQVLNVNSKVVSLRWYRCEQVGNVPSPRDSHSCCAVKEQIYVFGGQGKGDVFFNDLYQVSIQEKTGRDGHLQMYAEWKEIIISSGIPRVPPIKPRPRTSHTCVAYKNRYLIIVGGEAEVENTRQGLLPSMDKAWITEEKHHNRYYNKFLDQQQPEKGDIEVKKEALSDVWVFDSYYSRWKELKDLPFKIQAPSSSKKIKRYFEPRMAHTACALDQYVAIFGGLNSNNTTLVSNDLYVLSLDGNTNAILSENQQAGKRSRQNQENSSTHNSIPIDQNLKPNVAKRSKEELEVALNDMKKQQIRRQQVSGQIIREIINIGSIQNNTYINFDGKQKNQGRLASPRGAPEPKTVTPTRDAKVQTVEKACLFPSEQYFEQNREELALIMARNEFKLSSHQRTCKSFILNLAKQIGNPIQSLVAFIDNAVQAYFNFVTKNKLRKFTPLRIDVSILPATNMLQQLQKQQEVFEDACRDRKKQSSPAVGLALRDNSSQKELKPSANNQFVYEQHHHWSNNSEVCIRVKDNGPGMSDFKMKEVLTQFGLETSSQDNRQKETSNDYSTAEHGVGLKLNALRLGQTCLVISKMVYTHPNAPQMKEHRVSIGLISMKFLHDADTNFLLAPLVCYRLKNSTNFEPLTPFSDEIFSFILKYTPRLFSSEADFKKYVLQNFAEHGTEIFIMHMKGIGEHQSKELISRDGDIVQNPTVLAEMGLMQPPTSQGDKDFIPLENSLRQQLRFMYLHHPQFYKLHINGFKQSQSLLENPYARLYRQHGEIFVALRQEAFAIQMINSEVAIKKGFMQNPGKENLQQGVLLYRGNRFVRRLEGALDVVSPGADPDAMFTAAQAILGKRNHQQMAQGMSKQLNNEKSWFTNTSHGIVSVYKHKSGSTIPSKTDFCDRNLLRQIRAKVNSLREVKQEPQ